MHTVNLPPINDIDACTNAWLNVAKNPYVNVVGHSGEEMYKYDYEKVVPEFSRNGKLVEINESSFFIRKSAVKNCKKIALTCKKHGVKIVVNSYSHFSSYVGNVPLSSKLLQEIDFPSELIINKDKTMLKKYIKAHTNFFDSIETTEKSVHAEML